MLLRFVIIAIFATITTAAIYRILKNAFGKICEELDDKPSLNDRADEIARKCDLLSEDCIREARAAVEEAKRANEIKTKLERNNAK